MKNQLVPTLMPEKFTGIIQLKPSNEEELQRLQKILLEEFPNQTKVGKIDKEGNFISKLHCTLLHQAIPKSVHTSAGIRGDKALKAWLKSNGESVKTPDLELGSLGMVSSADRISTFVRVENTTSIKEFLNSVLEQAGLNPEDVQTASENDPRECNRVFHITLTNLTGNPGDSVADISRGIWLRSLK